VEIIKSMQQALLIACGVAALILIPAGLHIIDEGFVGVYWRGGALLNSVSRPGFNVKLPMITTFSQIQVSVQTDRVIDIPCGTSGGVLITFDSIEVVNRLSSTHVIDTVRKYGVDYDKIWIFDKIHHEINQFCSAHTLQEVYIDMFDSLDESLTALLQADCDKWDTGIEIITTRVTKPRIPKSIARDYEAMEAEKTKLLISTQHQRVIEKEAETERLRAMISAEKQAEVSKIMMEKDIAERKANQRIQSTEDRMYLAKQKALADAEFYKQQKFAEGNALKLTSEYLQYQAFTAIRDRPKLYFGRSLPDMFLGATPSHFLHLPNSTASGGKASPSAGKTSL